MSKCLAPKKLVITKTSKINFRTDNAETIREEVNNAKFQPAADSWMNVQSIYSENWLLNLFTHSIKDIIGQKSFGESFTQYS